MTDAERLALQREILAANGDEETMRQIADRHGIDPDLWKFWVAQMRLRDAVTDALKPVADALLRAANKRSR